MTGPCQGDPIQDPAREQHHPGSHGSGVLPKATDHYEDETYEARLADYHRRAATPLREQTDRLARSLDRMRAANPEPTTRASARAIGDMALLDVGCVAWAKTDMHSDLDARGGLIVEVTDAVDQDELTGEITRRRAFRCFDFYRSPGDWSAWCTLTEEQVDLDACEAPLMSRLRANYRRICRLVGGSRGVAHKDELELVSVAARLAALVGQRWS